MGLITLRYLHMKEYNWRAVWNIPTWRYAERIKTRATHSVTSCRGKLCRVAQQFTPYSWMHFDWRPLASMRRFLAVLGITCFVRVALNHLLQSYPRSRAGAVRGAVAVLSQVHSLAAAHSPNCGGAHHNAHAGRIGGRAGSIPISRRPVSRRAPEPQGHCTISMRCSGSVPSSAARAM